MARWLFFFIRPHENGNLTPALHKFSELKNRYVVVRDGTAHTMFSFTQ